MILHELFGQHQVTFFERLHNLNVLFARLRCVVRRLVQHGDQGGSRREVTQCVREQTIAQAFGQTDMKVP